LLLLLPFAAAGNAFAVYPPSTLKSVAIVTMVVDQLTYAAVASLDMNRWCCCELAAAGNAFAVYPPSTLKSVAIVTMVVDQLTAFGLFVHPLCILWEKLLRVHYKPNWIRLPSRIPVGELPTSDLLSRVLSRLLGCLEQ
jgi:hypothetical protein